MARELAALEKEGRLPASTATLEALQDLVVEAQARLVRGDARSATSRLYALVEAPRFAAFRDTATFANAEFLLGRALARGGATVSAERYLTRLLGRGPSHPYFVPAFRALVDVALQTREAARIAQRARDATRGQTLPADSREELAYLDGKAAYERADSEGEGALAEAEAQLARVSRRCRLYPAAVYYRGLIAARARAFPQARAAFCQIVDQRANDRLSFNIDQRFYTLKDLAALALGRVAHEQDRYDEAYYFYFSIPQESDRLPEALFEASWSMSQKGEFAAARAFSEQFDRTFPHSPLRPEVAILRANLAVKTCAFDRARAEAAALVDEYAPLQRRVAAALRDPEVERAVIERLLLRGRSGESSGDDDGKLLDLLKLDERFRSLERMRAEVDGQREEAIESGKAWNALGRQARAAHQQLPATASEAGGETAVAILEDVPNLAALAEGNGRLRRRLAALAADAAEVAYPPRDAGPYVDEARSALELARRLTTLQDQLDDAILRLAHEALRELDGRLRSILSQVRLVHIDAVVGKKKRLEIEMARLADGQLPADLFRKLQAEGRIGDDEIYWPFEGESWADEYENYR